MIKELIFSGASFLDLRFFGLMIFREYGFGVWFLECSFWGVFFGGLHLDLDKGSLYN